jgi:hypothetical protein
MDQSRKKSGGVKKLYVPCQERESCATTALCMTLLLAAPRMYSVLLFQKIRGLFDSSMRLGRVCLRASLPSLDSSWVKAAKAEDGSQPSRQSSRIAPGQGLTNHLDHGKFAHNIYLSIGTACESLAKSEW